MSSFAKRRSSRVREMPRTSLGGASRRPSWPQPPSPWCATVAWHSTIRCAISPTHCASFFSIALDRLVLRPLGIKGVRLATQRRDFSAAYDPKWVYHGLLVGPLREAAALLQRRRRLS